MSRRDRSHRNRGPDASGGEADRARPPRAGLSGEDRELWEHAARSITPLRGVKPRVHAGRQDAAGADGGARPALRHDTRVTGVGHRQTPPPKPHPVHAPPPAAQRAPPPLAEFDRRKARRIARGAQEIEARIDLHGMKQREAHAALVAFLRRCHADGLATVLVITGKGARTAPDPGDLYDFFGERERGALKRNVPHWLAEPELRGLVVSHRPAAIRHGGEGALYVQLRRKRI